MVGGYFNATVGNDLHINELKCIDRNDDTDSTSENGHRLLEFAEEHNLSILNTFFGCKNIHRWSFYSNLGYKRRLDYILGEWFIKRFTNNCSLYRGASLPFESDHMIVVLDCVFPYKKQPKTILKSKKQQTKHYDIGRLRDDNDIAEKYSNKLEMYFLLLNSPIQ